MPTGAAVQSQARRAVRELRRARRRTRLGRLEWFEVAYRAYLVALVGGATLGVVASWIPADPVPADTLQRIMRDGPGVVGAVVAAVLAVGVRSGAAGGPLAVEAADVRWMLLAPVGRRIVLSRPCVQRLSTLGSAGLALGGVGGLLAAPRLGAPRAWFAVIGGATSAAVLVAAGAVAMLVHASGVRPMWARLAAATLVVAQGVAATRRWPGPLTALGDVVLWPVARDSSSLVVAAVAAVVVASLAATAWVCCGALSPERLERRTDLVAQLRFAVAMGDLRTVMVLRRQLAHDQIRRTPWVNIAPRRPGHRSASSWVVWRSVASLVRLPVVRVLRLVALSGAAGAVAVAVVHGSVALVVVLGGLLFVIGLDLTEALAQTVDQVDRRQLMPMPSGHLTSWLLAAPAVVMVPLAACAVLVAVAVGGGSDAIVVGAVIALPAMWAGATGAVVNVVRGAPDPMARAARSLAMPPEVAGMSTLVQTSWPMVVSVGGASSLLFVTAAHHDGGSLVAAGVRGAVAALLWSGAVVAWVRMRDDARRRWRTLVAAGDEARRDAAMRRRARAEGTT